jgi:hypothetical protein
VETRAAVEALRRELRDQAEIEDHHAPLARDQHVLRLDVPVDVAGGVQRAEPLRELAQQGSQAVPVGRRPRSRRRRWIEFLLDRRSLARGRGLERMHHRAAAQRRGRPADAGREKRITPHEVHREEPARSVGHQLVELDQIRVRDVGERAEFFLEPIDGGRVRLLEDLQGDRRASIAIEHFVHAAVGAGAEVAQHAETIRPLELLRLEVLSHALAPDHSAPNAPGLANSRAGDHLLLVFSSPNRD